VGVSLPQLGLPPVAATAMAADLTAVLFQVSTSDGMGRPRRPYKPRRQRIEGSFSFYFASFSRVIWLEYH
jgi:hypothetical protein